MAKMVHSDVNRIRLSKHAQEQAVERGVTQAEVKEAVRKGSRQPATRGREMCRYNFAFHCKWQGKTLRNQTGGARHQGGSKRNSCYYRLRILLLRRTLMKISYDAEIDALYIRLLEGRQECRSVRLSDEVALNIGAAD